jgi:MFS transporter, FHS family, glucose/mannose:H+ symporter
MSHGTFEAKPVLTRRILSSLVLGTGFSLTGAGTVMLGALLPVFSQRWALRDDASGLLLFLQFAGSALGAVFTGSHRIRSLTVGYGLLVLATCALAFSGSHTPFAAFFFYGLGLGMAMTSTSLLVTDRSGDQKAAKLQALNSVWSAGATAGPMLFVPILHKGGIRLLFLALMALFLLLLAWVIFRERNEPNRAPELKSQSHVSRSAGFLFPYVILAICAVGVETALSGWLTTYSQRAGLGSMAGAAIATSIFCFGGMLSRLALSTSLLAKIGRRATLRAAVWGVVVSVAVLIVAPYPAVILAVGALAGVCVGPLYPLLLSFMLERSAGGWIFAVGGFGAAVLPWLTGLLSSHFNSLRFGLMVPCAASLIMAIVRPEALRRGN